MEVKLIIRFIKACMVSAEFATLTVGYINTVSHGNNGIMVTSEMWSKRKGSTIPVTLGIF